MSAAAAAAVTDAVPVKSGKKKLVIIAAAALAVLLAGGGATVFMLKKKAAAAEAAELDGADEERAPGVARPDTKHPPAFVALDTFTVNLADREAERYAQVGVTLEVVDAKAGEDIKAYMPAIRNNILMLLAQKNSLQLLDRKGKERLAAEIRRDALKPLGYTLELEDDAIEGAPAETIQEEVAKKKKKKKAQVEEPMPITAVHFSNFIIQ